MTQDRNQASSTGSHETHPLPIPQQQQALDSHYVDSSLMDAYRAYSLEYKDDDPNVVDMDTVNELLEFLGPDHPFTDFSFASNLPGMNGERRDSLLSAIQPSNCLPGPSQDQNRSHQVYSQHKSDASQGHLAANFSSSSVPQSSWPGPHHPSMQNTARVDEPVPQLVFYGDTPTGPEFASPIQTGGNGNGASYALGSEFAPWPAAEAQGLTQGGGSGRSFGFGPLLPGFHQHGNDDEPVLRSAESPSKKTLGKKRAHDEYHEATELENKAPFSEQQIDTSLLHQSPAANSHKRVRSANALQAHSSVAQPVAQPYQKAHHQPIISPYEAQALRMYPQPGKGSLEFADRAQALAAAATIPTRWDFKPPMNDISLPHNDTSRAYYVRQLVAAFHNTEGAINSGLGPHQQRCADLTIGENKYTPQEIETVCWQLVAHAEALHTHGPRIFGIFDESKMSQIYKSRYQSFTQRIGFMCEAVTLSKARCDMLLKGESLEMFVGTAMTTISQSKSMKKTNGKRWEVMAEARNMMPGDGRAHYMSGPSVPAHLAAGAASASSNIDNPSAQKNRMVPQQVTSPYPANTGNAPAQTYHPEAQRPAYPIASTPDSANPSQPADDSAERQMQEQQRQRRSIVSRRALAYLASVPQVGSHDGSAQQIHEQRLLLQQPVFFAPQGVRYAPVPGASQSQMVVVNGRVVVVPMRTTYGPPVPAFSSLYRGQPPQ
ncbi:hypothetical protein J1614_010925 [Plenodomus biglobosus]|nr:hypothetical protein J1614_010925 [Plenodomus biglobosus]